MFSRSPQNRPLGASGASLCSLGPQTGAPECPRGAQRVPKAPFLGSFFALFSTFLLSDCRWGPKGSPGALQSPKVGKNELPGLQKPSQKHPAMFKTLQKTEQPKRKKLKKQSMPTELPKRTKTSRCGGVALAFSI